MRCSIIVSLKQYQIKEFKNIFVKGLEDLVNERNLNFCSHHKWENNTKSEKN